MCLKKIFFLMSIITSFDVSALVKENIEFNHTDMSIISRGFYNPTVDGEKSGLNAERIAIKNGINNLEKYFESSSCDGLDKSSVDIKSGWEDSFHSQGTEIYSNGVLAVTLQAPIKQVFKSKLKKSIKTDTGEKIFFQIVGQVPLSAIRCGTIEVNLGNNKKIRILPIDSVKETSTNKKTTIHLVFNTKANNLELDPDFKKTGEEILENSTLASDEDAPSEILPVSVLVDKSKNAE